VQQHDGVALSHVHVRHLAAEDPSPLLLVRKCRRDHVGCPFSQSASSPLLILALDAHDPLNHATSEMHIIFKIGEGNVRFGSKADIGARPVNVRFTPKSGHHRASRARPRVRGAQTSHFRSQFLDLDQIQICRGQTTLQFA
jgi:hypothetical protein